MILTQEEILKNETLLKNSMSILDKLGHTIHTHIHILYVIKELMKDECKNYLEIGVYRGTSIALVMQSEYKTNFYGIENFSHPHGTHNPTKLNKNITQHNKHEHEFNIINGDSTSKITIEKIHKTIPDGVDLFFIDGHHEENGALLDLTNYFDLINPGGIIVFDDYTTTPDIRACIDPWVKEHKNELNVIGVIKNITNATDAHKGPSDENITFIMQKK